MSLRQGYGDKVPIVPNREATQRKSSQGAKRYLTGYHRIARFYLSIAHDCAQAKKGVCVD